MKILGNMKRMATLTFIFFALLNAFLFSAAAQEAHTRAEVREEYVKLIIRRDESPYLIAPVVSGEYASGSLTDEALSDASASLNFIRYLAYLDGNVELDM